jgi:hypothetical protein
LFIVLGSLPIYGNSNNNVVNTCAKQKHLFDVVCGGHDELVVKEVFLKI